MNDTHNIQWDEPTPFDDGSPFVNPPQGLTVRGVRYINKGRSIHYHPKEMDWFLVAKPEQPQISFWICEQVPGEFDQCFLPRESPLPVGAFR